MESRMQTCGNAGVVDGERYDGDLKTSDLILDDVRGNAAKHAFMQHFVEVHRRQTGSATMGYRDVGAPFAELDRQ
jgi:hypothetical protein